MFAAPDRRAVFVPVFVFSLCFTGLSYADGPSLLRMFQRTPKADGQTRHVLSEEDGPWLILASTFVGNDSKRRAEQLAAEIRSEFRLPAFIYKEKFDFTQSPGLAATGRKRLRYANEYQYEAYAVLVGEYDTFDHPSVDRDLKKLKSANLKVFRQPDIASETDAKTPVTTVKAIHKFLTERGSKDKKRGPMSNAFVTRNPMLPEEFFAAPQVDSFVQQLNEGNEFSLLKCKGRYTVVVRTFEGLGTFVDGKKDKEFVPSIERLDKFAVAANKMVKELRKKGEEAYEFHDRHRSLVTVGSFDHLGREMPGGGFEYSPEIREVMKKYSAFNNQHARSINGSQAVAAHHIAMIPFDVQPKPIAIPKKSKRGLVVGRR